MRQQSVRESWTLSLVRRPSEESSLRLPIRASTTFADRHHQRTTTHTYTQQTTGNASSARQQGIYYFFLKKKTMRSILSVLHRTNALKPWQLPARTTFRSGGGPRMGSSKFDSICARCRQQQQTTQIRFSSNRNNGQMGDDARWLSVVDHPAQVVRVGRKHGPGLIILGMYMTATSLGPLNIRRHFSWPKQKLIVYFLLP